MQSELFQTLVHDFGTLIFLGLSFLFSKMEDVDRIISKVPVSSGILRDSIALLLLTGILCFFAVSIYQP